MNPAYAAVSDEDQESHEQVGPIATLDLDLQSEVNQSPYSEVWSDLDEAAGPQAGSIYTIQSGDTLSEIAAKSGVSVDDLAELNGIEDVDAIPEGGTLYIPTTENNDHPGGAVLVEGERPLSPQAQAGTTSPTSVDDASEAGTTDVPNREEKADPSGGATTDPETATLGPEPTYSFGEQALAVGGAAAFGSLLGQRLDLDGTAEQTAFHVLNNTFQKNVRHTFDNKSSTEGFDDFGSDLQTGFQHAGAGLVAAELSDSLGFDGSSFGDQLGSAITQQAVTAPIRHLPHASVDAYAVDFEAANDGMFVRVAT